MMFVRGAEHDPALRMIAESAVKLGHSLGMVVTAEWVTILRSLMTGQTGQRSSMSFRDVAVVE